MTLLIHNSFILWFHLWCHISVSLSLNFHLSAPTLFTDSTSLCPQFSLSIVYPGTPLCALLLFFKEARDKASTSVLSWVSWRKKAPFLFLFYLQVYFPFLSQTCFVFRNKAYTKMQNYNNLPLDSLDFKCHCLAPGHKTKMFILSPFPVP